MQDEKPRFNHGFTLEHFGFSTPEQIRRIKALEAITINATHTIGMADIIGSPRAGKRADFTVLDDDPLNCEQMALRDIGICATVFEGRVFPIP